MLGSGLFPCPANVAGAPCVRRAHELRRRVTGASVTLSAMRARGSAPVSGRERLKDRGAAGVVSGETGWNGARPTPRGWLYTIALRLAFNEQRRHRRLLAAVTRVRHRPWHDRADPDLRDALARLDPRARSALLLNAVDGYTQREVAGILGIPEGTVGRIVSEARAALRADLDGGA